MNMTASDIGFFVEPERPRGRPPGKPRRKVGRPRGTAKFCESCQASYSADRRHLKSVIHRKGRRIRALLAQDCLTFDEIGRRIGVTREYVRQLAQRMGSEKGHDRQRSCTVSRREIKKLQVPQTHPKLMGRLRQLQEDGYEIRLTDSQIKSRKNNFVSINGIRATIHCLLAEPIKRRPCSPRAYLHVTRQNRSEEIAIIYCAFDDTAYVVPASWLPPENIFLPKGELRRTTKAVRDWEQWRDRWDLFRRE